MTATSPDLIDDLVNAWARWRRQPGAEHTARHCEAACRAIAGPQTTAMREFITDHLRERSDSVREAATTWLAQQETHAA